MQIEEYRKLWQRRLPASRRLEDLEAALGYTFQDKALLYEALTHRSAVTTSPPAGQAAGQAGHVSLAWNERMEFLGDAVLGLAIGSRLIERSEVFAEGELSKLRAALVNEAFLASVARRIDLGNWLIIGRGEELAGGRDKDSLLADAVEAVLGAVFRDGGFERARTLVALLFGDALGGALEGLKGRDFKSELQELVQARLKARPEYVLVDEGGPAHAKSFAVAVFIGSREWGRGRGASKKRASQEAARNALANLHNVELSGNANSLWNTDAPLRPEAPQPSPGRVS